MSHGNTIVNGNGIELSSITAHLLNLLTDYLTNLVQMGMTRYKLRERVDNSNNRLAKLLVFHTSGHPQGAGTSHSPTFRAHSTTQWMFHICLVYFLL